MFGRRKSKRPPKEGRIARLKRQGRETLSLGQTLLHNPRAFPGEAMRLARRSFRRLWDAHGGGFYACGLVVAFLFLEVETFIQEVSDSDGVVDFFTEQFWEFLLRFSVQSLVNSLIALAWPVMVLDWLGAWSILFLASAYVVFALAIKAPLTAWLFNDDGEQQSRAGASETVEATTAASANKAKASASAAAGEADRD